jgi:hypothetical protein
VPGDNNSPGISAVAADVAGEPLDDCANVLGPSWPPIVRRKPIIHRYADHAMPDRPATDMVVERKVSHLLVAGGVPATMHKNEHRPRRHPNCSDVVNVQSMSRMGSVGYVPLDSRRQIVSGPLRSHIQLVRALDHLWCELATELTQPPPNLNSVGHIASIAGLRCVAEPTASAYDDDRLRGYYQLDRLTQTSYRVPEHNPTAVSPSCGAALRRGGTLFLRVRLVMPD